MTRNNGEQSAGNTLISSSVDELLLASLQRGGESLETGRYLATFKEGALDAGLQSMKAQGLKVADTRDFEHQTVDFEHLAGADAIVFPELGVAMVGGDAAQERGMTAQAEVATDDPIDSIDPEYFMFPATLGNDDLSSLAAPPEGVSDEYLRGFLRAAEVIARDMQPGHGNGNGHGRATPLDTEAEALVLGTTWGLTACRAAVSARSGAGIRVAILDTGFDRGHPDFAGRSITGQTFVGQPVQDLHGHGTHCTGTSTGPVAPVGPIPRYGIGYRSSIMIGKVLTNSGSGTSASVLAGMNWAIAQGCAVISMSLGAPIGVQPYYTAAGLAALNRGCLIIAAAGNEGGATGAPANSPTIMSVASLDPNLSPSSFSNHGKIEIAAPGRDVFSSVPRPRRYGTMSGTSMATPHVAGCAALWAETSPNLRGRLLWRKLQQTARRLPYPASRVGAGLVQAP